MVSTPRLAVPCRAAVRPAAGDSRRLGPLVICKAAANFDDVKCLSTLNNGATAARSPS